MNRFVTGCSSFRWALFGVLMLANLYSTVTGATAQPATPATGPDQSVVTRARLDAVPMGQSATVGSLEFVVTGYDQDATDLLEGEAGGPPGWDEERYVNIAMTLTNVGESEVAFGDQFRFDRELRFAGNRGIVNMGSTINNCVVANDVYSQRTPPLAPGASLSVNHCVAVLVDDLASLQMLVIDAAATDADASWADRVESGTWFDLGAPRPYDPGVATEQARVALAIAPNAAAPWTSPATAVTTTGNLVAELLDYRPDVTTEISGDEGWHYLPPDPGEQWVSASLRLTNVGDRPAIVRVYLLGHEGVGRHNAAHSKVFEHESHLLLPGGSALWTGQWVMPELDSARVLAVTEADAPGAPVTWLLADPGTPFTWEVPLLRLADPAEASDLEGAVPLGETASLGVFNMSMEEDPAASSGDVFAYAFTVTHAGGPAQGAVLTEWTVDIAQSSTASCPDFSVFRMDLLFLPGGSTGFDMRCPTNSDPSIPLRVNIVNLTTGEESTGLFAREPTTG